MPGFDDEEPEVYVVPLDEFEETTPDPLRNADWTGLANDFDGESLIDNILSGDTE